MKKRIVSWLLVLVMVFGMIPMPTHAADAADYSAYVHRKAQFNPVYESATFPITAAPDNVEWSTATQLQGAAIPDDLVVVIDAYYADTTKNALWFKVSAAEGYTLPDALSAEPWVFQDAISYSMGASLVFLPCEICGQADCVSKHENWCNICRKDDCGEDHSKPTDPSEPEDLPLVDEATGITVSGEGIPEGAEVVVGVPNVDVGPGAGIFDIKMMVDGEEWQPIDNGTNVTVSIPVNTGTRYVDVYHYIDHAADINGDEQFVPISNSDSSQLSFFKQCIDAYEQTLGSRDHIAIEKYEKIPVVNGSIEILTDSYSVFYYDGSQYGDSDGNDTAINFEPTNGDNGKNYFVTRGTVIKATKGWNVLGSWTHSDVFSRSGTNFTVLPSAELHHTYSITLSGVGSSTIYFSVMPELTIYFAHNINRSGVTVALPSTISGIFMGNSNTHNPDNGQYAALNYTLPEPTVSTEGYTFSHWYVQDAPTKTFNANETIYLSADTLDVKMDNAIDSYEVTLVAAFEIDDYTITYDLKGGNMPDGIATTQTYEIVDTLEIPKPVRDGYTFTGWSVSSSDDAQNWTSTYTTIPGGSSLTQMYGDVTLTATWEANGDTPYTVYHHFQNRTLDGYLVSTSTDTLYGTTGEATNAALTQRIVAGFEVESIEEKIINGDGTTEVIIKYKRVERTITFNSLGGTNVASITAYYGTSISAPNPPTREHYIFVGWYTADAPTKLYTFTTMPATDLTLYARWEARRTTITLIDTDGTVLYVINQDAGTEISAPENPTKDGYTFVGWNPALPETMGDQDITLTAQWNSIGYTATYNPNGGKINGSVDEYSVNYTIEGSLDVPTLTRDGYEFKGWKVAEASGNWTKDDVVQGGTPLTGKYGDVKLTAQWEPIRYTITYHLDGAENPGNPTFYTVETKDFTLISPQKAGYRFDGWTSNVGATFDYGLPKVDVSQANRSELVLTAKWVKTFNVTLHYNYTGCTDAVEVVDKDSTFVLPSPERDSHNFLGWYTAATGGEKVESPITVNDDVELYAQWMHKKLDHPIVVGINMMYHNPNGDYQDGISESAYHRFPNDPRQFVDNNGIRVYLLDGKWTLTKDYELTLPHIAGYYISEDIISMIADGEIGVRDDDGSTIYELLGDRLDFDGIVDAWKTNGEQFCKTFNFENDIQWDKVKNAKFNVIPYVIKFHSGKWFVDLVILPEYQRTLSYKLNLDPNYSGASVPADRWYTGGFTATVVAPSGSPSYTVDGLTYTARFDHWMGSDGKRYDPNNEVTMNADLTLTAQWTYPAKYAVKHYLENADDDGYTLAKTVYATGLIGADTQAKAETYNGFTAKAFSQTKIVEDGSAEVAIYYSRDTYKVSYKVNAQTPAGITVPAEKIYKWGATVEVAENLTSAHYNFSAWETTGVSQIQNGSFTMPKNPVEFVSNCTYTVRFHSNFGTEVTKDEMHTYGASKVLGNNTFTRDGYQFIGWSADPNAVDATYADGESVTNLSTDSNAVAHLYAVWKRITHTVTYSGGTYVDYVNQEFTVDYGTEITIPEAAWDDNHKLEYWLGANGSTYRPGDKVTVQDDMTFTAIWLTRYTVVHHYKRLDNTWSEYSSTNNWGTAGEMTDAQAYSGDTGFKVNRIENVELSLNGDTVVHIYYDRLSYTLRYEVTCENGPVPSTATQTYEVTVPYYTEVNIISEADQPGYTFSGWTVVENDVIPNENGTFRMPAHAVTIKGTWTQLRYDISYSFDNHPNQAAAPDRITDRVYGDKYTLPEVRVPEGWRFLGWKEAGSESETYLQPGTELSVTDSKTYVGYFEEIYCTLTYIADLEGSEVPATQKVKYGTEVTIQNIVKIPEGYTFEHWQVMDSEETYEPDAVVELKADLTLYPKWTPNVYNILFYMQKGNGVPEAVGTVTGYPETYAENVQIGPWPEVTGYQFEKWELRKALTDTIYAQSSESVFSFKMPAHNLVAIVKLTPKNDAGYTVIFREKLGDNSYKEIKREEASNLTYDRQFTISTAIPGFSTIDPALTEVTVTAGYNTIVYVDYTRNSYNLYYAGNGVGDRTEQVPYGKEVQPGIPTLEGHSFIGWLMDANLNGQKDEGETILGENQTFTMPASDLRLIAQWNVVEYAIEYVFVPNDMAELDGKTTKYGLLVEFPVSEITVPTGYELSWSAKTKAGTQITDDGKKFTMPAADVVVTGTFTPIEYTINFDSNQGDSVEAQTYTIATDIALPTPTRTNYDFVGWQILSADAESNWSQTGNLLGTIPKGQYGNVTLKAQWKLQTKKMTVSVSGVDSDHNSIFRIYGSTLDGETVDLQIIINGNGSKVITGIPVGNYTVTEISGWTWRYIGDMSKTAELVNGNYVANFSFGAVGNPYWINDYSYGVFWRGGGQ